MKKYVIDTNVFIESISPKIPYHIIFQSLIDVKFQPCISNENLLEYKAITSQFKTLTQHLLITRHTRLHEPILYLIHKIHLQCLFFLRCCHVIIIHVHS